MRVLNAFDAVGSGPEVVLYRVPLHTKVSCGRMREERSRERTNGRYCAADVKSLTNLNTANLSLFTSNPHPHWKLKFCWRYPDPIRVTRAKQCIHGQGKEGNEKGEDARTDKSRVHLGQVTVRVLSTRAHANGSKGSPVFFSQWARRCGVSGLVRVWEARSYGMGRLEGWERGERVTH